MIALSPTQLRALRLLSRGGFIRSAAGWHPPDDDAGAFGTSTMNALARRGLARLRGRHHGRLRRPCAAFITRDGERALRGVQAAAAAATLPLPFAAAAEAEHAGAQP